MRKKIFFDLDGTLLDSRLRMHGLFMELAAGEPIPFDEYWELKRKPVNQKDLLTQRFGYSDDQVKDFHAQWLSKIEDEKRLVRDVVFDGVTDLLKTLSATHDLYVVTARQNPDYAVNQLQQLGLAPFLKNILVTRQAGSKADLVRSTMQVAADDIYIGDTKEDIETGRALGVKTIAVCSGFLCREALARYQPDFILESVTDLHETGLL